MNEEKTKKIEMVEYVEHFDCACHSPEHTIRFTLDKDDCGDFFYLDIHLTKCNGILKRIWYAIKYVFGYQCSYGCFDSWMLKEKDTDRLIKLLQSFKEKKPIEKEIKE